jgi:hypothetical protein
MTKRDKQKKAVREMVDIIVAGLQKLSPAERKKRITSIEKLLVKHRRKHTKTSTE